MALRVLFPGSLDVFDVLRVCKHQHGCFSQTQTLRAGKEQGTPQ